MTRGVPGSNPAAAALHAKEQERIAHARWMQTLREAAPNVLVFLEELTQKHLDEITEEFVRGSTALSGRLIQIRTEMKGRL